MSSHGDYKPPITNLDLWLTKLRLERKAKGTVRLFYAYLARRFLGLLDAQEGLRQGRGEPLRRTSLRHLYATEMLRNGAKLEVVGRIMGHSNIGITADVYRHINRGEMREEAERYAPMNGGTALS